MASEEPNDKEGGKTPLGNTERYSTDNNRGFFSPSQFLVSSTDVVAHHRGQVSRNDGGGKCIDVSSDSKSTRSQNLRSNSDCANGTLAGAESGSMVTPTGNRMLVSSNLGAMDATSNTRTTLAEETNAPEGKTELRPNSGGSAPPVSSESQLQHCSGMTIKHGQDLAGLNDMSNISTSKSTPEDSVQVSNSNSLNQKFGQGANSWSPSLPVEGTKSGCSVGAAIDNVSVPSNSSKDEFPVKRCTSVLSVADSPSDRVSMKRVASQRRIQTRSRSQRAKINTQNASPITSDISESNLDSDDDSECTISAYSDNGNLGLSKRVTRSSKRICTRKGVIGKGGKMRLREAGGGGASSKEVGRASQSRRTLSKGKQGSHMKRLGIPRKHRGGMHQRRYQNVLDSSQTSESSGSEFEVERRGRRGHKRAGRKPLCDLPQRSRSRDEEYFPPSKKKRQMSTISNQAAAACPLPKGSFLADILTDIPEVDILPLPHFSSSSLSANISPTSSPSTYQSRDSQHMPKHSVKTGSLDAISSLSSHPSNIQLKRPQISYPNHPSDGSIGFHRYNRQFPPHSDKAHPNMLPVKISRSHSLTKGNARLALDSGATHFHKETTQNSRMTSNQRSRLNSSTSSAPQSPLEMSIQVATSSNTPLEMSVQATTNSNAPQSFLEMSIQATTSSNTSQSPLKMSVQAATDSTKVEAKPYPDIPGVSTANQSKVSTELKCANQSSVGTESRSNASHSNLDSSVSSNANQSTSDNSELRSHSGFNAGCNSKYHESESKTPTENQTGSKSKSQTGMEWKGGDESSGPGPSKSGSNKSALARKDGGGKEDSEGEESLHFKALRSWEADCTRGTKATRGPMLYMMEKFPEKLNFDGPWMTKAKMIWTMWRHKVPESERKLYTEKAKKNRMEMSDSVKNSKSKPRPSKKATANKEVLWKDVPKHESTSAAVNSDNLTVSLDQAKMSLDSTRSERSANLNSLLVSPVTSPTEAAEISSNHNFSKSLSPVGDDIVVFDQQEEQNRCLPISIQCGVTENAPHSSKSFSDSPRVFSSYFLDNSSQVAKDSTVNPEKEIGTAKGNAGMRMNPAMTKNAGSLQISKSLVTKPQHLSSSSASVNPKLFPSWSQITVPPITTLSLHKSTPLSLGLIPNDSQQPFATGKSTININRKPPESLSMSQAKKPKITSMTHRSGANKLIQKHSSQNINKKAVLQISRASKVVSSSSSSSIATSQTSRPKSARDFSSHLCSRVPANIPSFIIPKMPVVCTHSIVNPLPGKLQSVSTKNINSASKSNESSGNSSASSLKNNQASHVNVHSVSRPICYTPSCSGNIVSLSHNNAAAFHGDLLSPQTSGSSNSPRPSSSLRTSRSRSSSTSSSALSSPSPSQESESKSTRKSIRPSPTGSSRRKSSTVHHHTTFPQNPLNFYGSRIPVFQPTGMNHSLNDKTSQSSTSRHYASPSIVTVVSPPVTPSPEGTPHGVTFSPNLLSKQTTRNSKITTPVTSSSRNLPQTSPQLHAKQNTEVSLPPFPSQVTPQSNTHSPTMQDTSVAAATLSSPLIPTQSISPSPNKLTKQISRVFTPMTSSQDIISPKKISPRDSQMTKAVTSSQNLFSTNLSNISPMILTHRTTRNSSTNRIAAPGTPSTPSPNIPPSITLANISPRLCMKQSTAPSQSQLPLHLNRQVTSKKGKGKDVVSKGEFIILPPSPILRTSMSSPMIADPPNLYLKSPGMSEIKLETACGADENLAASKESNPSSGSSGILVDDSNHTYPSSSVTTRPGAATPTFFGGGRGQLPDLSNMTRWEMEQLYYYNAAILEQQKRVTEAIEKQLIKLQEENEQGNTLKLSSSEVYKRFLDFLVEPTCSPAEDPIDDIGFSQSNDSKIKFEDLVIGGTAFKPILNSKYDYYGNLAKLMSKNNA